MPSVRPNPPIAPDPTSTRLSAGTLALLGALVVAIGVPTTWALIHGEWRQQRHAIEMLATARATEAGAGWDRHLADARLLASAYPLAEAFDAWQDDGDARDLDLLARRLTALEDEGPDRDG